MRADLAHSTSWLVACLFILQGCNSGGGGGGGSRSLSSNAALSDLALTVGVLDQSFFPTRTIYIATVDFDVTSTDVTAILEDSSATASINGVLVSGAGAMLIDLDVGQNPIEITVTAEDGVTRRVYTVTVTRLANVRLADLSITAGTFDQIFQPTLMDYTATVGPLRSTTTVTATTEDPNTTVEMNGISAALGNPSAKFTLNQGTNTISVVTTAVDGVTTETYTIDIVRQPPTALSQRNYIKGGGDRVILRYLWDRPESERRFARCRCTRR